MGNDYSRKLLYCRTKDAHSGQSETIVTAERKTNRTDGGMGRHIYRIPGSGMPIDT